MPYPPRVARRARDPAGRAGRRSTRCGRPGSCSSCVTNQPDVARGTQTPGRGRGDQRAPCARRCRSTTCSSAFTTTRTAATAGSRSPGSCSRRPRATASTCGRASWSAIAGRTSRPGARAGCTAILIDYGYAESGPVGRPPTRTVRSLAEAADWILARTGTRRRRHDDVASTLRVKIFADGADKAGMLEMYRNPLHQGLHHQPDADAQGRHRRLPRVRPGRSSQAIPDRPISFEVFSDEFDEMERQAREIAQLGRATST